MKSKILQTFRDYVDYWWVASYVRYVWWGMFHLCVMCHLQVLFAILVFYICTLQDASYEYIDISWMVSYNFTSSTILIDVLQYVLCEYYAYEYSDIAKWLLMFKAYLNNVFTSYILSCFAWFLFEYKSNNLFIDSLYVNSFSTKFIKENWYYVFYPTHIHFVAFVLTILYLCWHFW